MVPESGSVPRTREFALTWVIVAAVVGGGMVAERTLRNGADGAQPIRERTGFVYDVARPAPPLDGPLKGKRTAVLFVRPDKVAVVCRWAASAPLKDVTMVVVAPQQVPCPSATLNVDSARRIAQGFSFRPAKDGGYPVGYALLDRRGGFVYNTLDRGYYQRNWWDRHLYHGKRWEMQTVLKDVP